MNTAPTAMDVNQAEDAAMILSPNGKFVNKAEDADDMIPAPNAVCEPSEDVDNMIPAPNAKFVNPAEYADNIYSSPLFEVCKQISRCR